MPYTSEQKIAADMSLCVQNCTNCHNICVQTIAYCIQMGGRHGDPGHLESLFDCAELCRVSADFMLRGSSMHSYTCGVCAEACERCAESCEVFADDEQMRACAEECRRCSETCREMARMKM